MGRKLELLPRKKKKVLEIGAGTGALLSYVTPEIYVGIDSSEKVLALLKKKHPYAIAIHSSGVNIPFKDSQFETVVSLHTLEHIYFIAEHIQEVLRVLKNWGRYYYVIPTEGGWAFSLGRKFFSGRDAKKRYGVDPTYIMEREHINDALRVLKFLRLYFGSIKSTFWPFRVPILSLNAMIYGVCRKKASSHIRVSFRYTSLLESIFR